MAAAATDSVEDMQQGLSFSTRLHRADSGRRAGAGEPSQPSGDSLLVFLQSVFTHELRAGILDLT